MFALTEPRPRQTDRIGYSTQWHWSLPRPLSLCSVSSSNVAIITDRVRSTTEGYVFTGVCLLTGGRGVYPSQVLMGEGVSQGTYPLARSRWGEGEGVPQGTYHPTAKVPTPLARSRWGVPQGTYPPGQGTYPPSRIGQHMVYLIHHGRYASCIHAGDLERTRK